MRSLALLQAEDEDEAARLAGDLKALNDSRKALTETGTKSAYEMIDGSSLKDDRVLVVFLPECHESLAGIIAGRVREKYHRPAFVLTRGEQMVKGSFGGIGSLITYNTKLKRSMIAEPFEGTPAAKAGLKAGDILMEIDGKDLAGKNNSEVSQMLRGQAGTSFKLKVERPNEKGGQTPMEFTIVRESIQTPAIPYATVMDNKVGYISLSTFSGNPSKDFKKALLDLKKQGATSLVIDLRNNGGGLLDEAVEIANYFLPRGKVIVTTKGKTKQASNTYKTLREPLDLDIPIAVLVNSGTASASEILSGSLQDLDRAVIVGNRTFGKGLVQVPRSLPYGGMMKVTTSKYYIPSGRCVQAIDYKHRNEDGSVGTIPDSLTNVFYTAAGREVRDGGGVMPDITVKQEKLPNILFYLVRDNLIFDYA